MILYTFINGLIQHFLEQLVFEIIKKAKAKETFVVSSFRYLPENATRRVYRKNRVIGNTIGVDIAL